jgi:hypothetical protein
MTPLLVCNIGWMSRYEGLDGKPDKIVGGGQYVKEHGKGHEVCNFLRCKDGYVYGHVETIKKDIDRQIRIENIFANAGKGDPESVSGVDVVWIATNPDEGGRRVVGWYRDATVYRRRQEFEKALLTRQHKRDEIDSYRIRVKGGNATLLRLEDRSDPALRLGTGTGWIGEANWWFPERQADPAIKKFVRVLRAFIDGHAEDIPKREVRGQWGGGSDIERKAQVEQAAIEAVRKHYKNHKVCTVEKDNVGWDLEAQPMDGGEVICLEVKGLFGSELKVGVTPNEYRALVRHRNGKKPHYRICVVTNALSDNPTLRIFRYESGVSAWFDDILSRPSALVIDPLESAIISLALAK